MRMIIVRDARALFSQGQTAQCEFAEMLEFIYILQSNANATRFLQKALGISANEAKKISSEMNNLETGHAFGKSYDEKNKPNKLRVRQFWREEGKQIFRKENSAANLSERK